MAGMDQISSSDLFIPIKFSTSVQIKPNELGPNIEEIIYAKLKNNLENMCSKHGYIKKNSIKIIKRSIGNLKMQHFNGNILYDLQCIAEICNPAQGSIIKCKVKAKNSLGLLAEGFYDNVPILQVIVPKISAGIQSEINIANVNIGDNINIEVCGKKFMLYDKYISIIGKAIKDRGVQNVMVDTVKDIDDENKPVDDIDNVILPDVVAVYEDEKSDLNGDEDFVEDEQTEADVDIPEEDEEELDEDDDNSEENFDDFEGGFEEPEFEGGDNYETFSGFDDFE